MKENSMIRIDEGVIDSIVLYMIPPPILNCDIVMFDDSVIIVIALLSAL